MDIKLYQIVYKPEQIDREEEFTLYDNSHNNCDKLHNHREYPAFLEAYKTGACSTSDYTGMLSWKFGKKTGWSGKQLTDAINISGDQEVYFINCGPGVKDVWSHGERRHPGITSIVQEVFDRLNIKIDISKIHHDISKTCFCNYWVGTSLFWDKYIEFSEPVYSYLAYDASPQLKDRIYTKADRGITCGYIPFIMERMFTTLLCIDRSITYKSFSKIK